MNKFQKLGLLCIRKVYQVLVGSERGEKPLCIQDAEMASDIIYKTLIADKPCMIGRFGAFELAVVVNYLNTRNNQPDYLGFIQGKNAAWWRIKSIVDALQNNAGFFPLTNDKVDKFCELMLTDIPSLDLLGSWLQDELYFEVVLKDCPKVNLELLNPYFSKFPWTNALAGKKVLVVHPFADTIRIQYLKRKLIFPTEILPDFDLQIIQAVQSIAGNKTNYLDWFDALESMKVKIDACDFDIAIIGCGAYGFPLAAHVKRIGKKAIHLGGSLQLLFGIKGKRWENPDYNTTYNYAKLMNEHWVYPSELEKPQLAASVEGGCYW